MPASEMPACPPIVRDPAAFSRQLNAERQRGRRIGFVPTMGALHEGHLQLVRALEGRADFVVASVFVNPTQFGPSEDFSRYPRDLDGDARKLGSVGTSLVFAPSPEAMYPAGDATRVRVAGLADQLCGPFRPGHFEGVATVVAKLFALTGPCVAAFGRKDFQQLALIRRLVVDLFLPVEIVGVPIVREADGLAMSSRNAYLSNDARARACALSRGIFRAVQAYECGERDAEVLRTLAEVEVKRAVDSIDYVTVADKETLVPRTGNVDGALLALACRIESTRLIDNFVLGEDDPRALQAHLAARAT